MAINQLKLPEQVATGRTIPIIIPIGSSDTFRQIDQITIRIVSDDELVSEEFIIGRTRSDPTSEPADFSTSTVSDKSLFLLDQIGTNIVNVQQARFLDNSADKRIKIDLMDVPDGVYEISGTLGLANFEIAMPVSPVRVGAGSSAATKVFTVANFDDDDSGPVPTPVQRVSLVETNREATGDQALWVYIRNGTVNFTKYQTFIDAVMTADAQQVPDRARRLQRGASPLLRTDAYGFLKQATDFYLSNYFSGNDDGGNTGDFDNTYQEDRANQNLPNAASRDAILEEQRRTRRQDDLSIRPGDEPLPYFQQVLNRLPDVLPRNLPGELLTPFQVPNLTLLELIWSYWHEEGGLVQTLNAISMRFQNVRNSNGRDALLALNIDPLRPINNLVWGYIQDERFRLSLAQRNYEYQYEYGLSLIGRAVPNTAVAESRSQFIPAFHNLLKAATDFYQQANYTTVIPDGFPILNHLREVHMILAEGAHNSFRDLPYTARTEMLTQQWILARPEMREFLGGRIMVPYTEPWMDRVDTMKNLQGWDPTNITHFHDLGRFGEQLLLSIRYGGWNGAGTGAINAANWAHYWREEIQRYIHGYKAVTGVDLGAEITDARISLPQQHSERYEQPAVLMNRRVGMLPPGNQPVPGFGQLSRQRTLREGR